MDKDISELLMGIKENIKVIESGDFTESLLSSVRNDFAELLELIKLFLISERDSYYGYFLMNMQLRADCRVNKIAGIKLNEFPPVLETNPLLLCKFNLKEIIYIICHEIDHVMFNHPSEMIKANPTGDNETFYRFNLAADAAVNDLINHEIITENRRFLAKPDGAITSVVLSDMFKLGKIAEMENYVYYYDLITQVNDDTTESGLKSGQQLIMSKQNKNDGIEEKNDENSDGIITAQNCGNGIQEHDWEAGNDTDDAEATVRAFINSVVDMMNDETRGMMPGKFIAQVERINTPPQLSWQAVLKKYIGTITANKRKTRTRLNRRQPERFDISGSVDDKILKIVVAIDTSGSVSDKMLSHIMNEIFAILAKRKHDITIIECDAEVNRVYKAKTLADVKTKVAGRGGTMFTPVIEHINNDKYYADALLIYFTDGYGESEIPKPRTYRNIWVVFDDEKNLSLKEPYGIVLRL